jgi:hypothetical protein
MKIINRLFLLTAALGVLAGVVPIHLQAQNIPSIVVQPTSQATAPSGTISFSVSASGAGTLAYQWAKNTTNLSNGAFSGRATVSGATTITLTLANITTNDQANYTCRITNSYGSITSSIASLTVYISPTITTQPLGHTNIVGTNITFSVVASGTTPFSYQWQQNDVDIPSATLNVYTITSATTNDSGSYTVSVSNPAGTANSSAANLLILNPPLITIQPTNTTVILSNPATFYVTATGSLLNYQWQKSGATINGATNNYFIVTNTSYSAGSSEYNVVITNLLGKVTSSDSFLYIVGPPTITSQPASQIVGVSSNVTFSIGVNAGYSPYSPYNSESSMYYQWFNTNSILTNQTGSLLTLENVQLTNTGGYFVVLSNSFGSITSSIANLIVQDFAPSIISQPIGENAPVGSDVVVSVTASGTPPLFFQWLQNGTNLTDGGNIIGSASNALSLSEVATSNSGMYSIIATNFYGSVTSSCALLNVGYPPAIVRQPISVITALGSNADLSCIVTGTAPIILQWLENGAALSEQTNNVLTLTNLELSLVNFQLEATNAFGSILSSNASINVNYVSNYPTNLFEGLVAYYPLDGNVNDASGNGNNGTTNDVNYTTNQFDIPNGAIEFNGRSTSAVTVPSSTSLNLYQSFTLSGWMFSTYVNPTDNGLGLIAKGGNSVAGTQWMARWMNTGQIELWLGNGNNWSEFLSASTYIEGTWQAFLISFDATTGTVCIYFNGKLDASYTTSMTSFSNPNAPLILGNQYESDVDAFIGCLDNVRIYNRVLSTNEVTQLYDFENGSLIPQSLSFNFNPNNAFQLQFWGTPNFPYILQTATNLTPPIIWQSVCTNVSDPFGNWISTDTNTTAYPSKFYRASVPQTNN